MDNQLDKNFIDYANFFEVADEILNKAVIRLQNDKQYRICEVEFYLRSKNHPDLYVHQNPEQQQFHQIYFHQFKNGSFKEGNYKGMDFCFGDPNKYYGILIRSIYDIQLKKMITGPCLVVNEIIGQYNHTKLKEFAQNFKIGKIFDKNNFLYLQHKILDKEQIYKGARVGLSDKYPKFKNLNYRFLIKKNLIKKQKKDLIPAQ